MGLSLYSTLGLVKPLRQLGNLSRVRRWIIARLIIRMPRMQIKPAYMDSGSMWCSAAYLSAEDKQAGRLYSIPIWVSLALINYVRKNGSIMRASNSLYRRAAGVYGCDHDPENPALV